MRLEFPKIRATTNEPVQTRTLVPDFDEVKEYEARNPELGQDYAVANHTGETTEYIYFFQGQPMEVIDFRKPAWLSWFGCKVKSVILCSWGKGHMSTKMMRMSNWRIGKIYYRDADGNVYEVNQ